jgi:hypothetical protein
MRKSGKEGDTRRSRALEVWITSIPRRFMRIPFHRRLSCSIVAPITSGKERIMILLSTWSKWGRVGEIVLHPRRLSSR